MAPSQDKHDDTMTAPSTTILAFPRHAPIGSFGSADGELTVGGVPLARLAARVGRTPFYAYSRDAISRRVAQVRQALPPAVELHYAMKANPMPALVGHLAGLTDGIDVASAAEMHTALDAGVAPERISFAGPGKTGDELAQAVAAGITINLESERQYGQAMTLAARLAVSPQLAIRINPAFELKSSGMKMGGGPKPFGIDQDEVPGLLARMRSDGVDPVGFHIYCGSQNLDAVAIVEAQRQSVALALELAKGLRNRLRWLNIGGGFGVTYFAGEQPLDLAPIASALHGLSRRVEAELAAPIVLELGRYLVAEAGVYVSRVIDRKISCGQVFLVVDGGLHHNLAASGNFGQVIRKNYPVCVGNRLDDPVRENQSVVGPLCTPLDLLADRVDLPRAAPGDLFVVFMAGAYGRSASPTAFLSHPAAAEVLV